MDAERALNEEDRVDDELAPLSDERALRRRVERQLNKRKEFNTHLVSYAIVNALLAGLFFTLGIPWVAGIVALAWGSGLAAHAVDTYYQTGKRAAIRTARVQQAFRDDYGPRWDETASQADLRRTLKRVDEPFAKRREFISHLVVFAAINAMLWWIYLSVMPGDFPWPLFATGFWGVGLVAQALEVLSSKRRQPNIEREVERQRRLLEEAQWGSEKPKNDDRASEDVAAMQIGPDGELIGFGDDEPEEKSKRR